jgi:HD superfamily phosphodiesterase
MKLTASVESAEIQLKKILEEFFISNYEEDSLPSHGIDHHRRVWKKASELLLLLSENNMANDRSMPQQLIVACYLHDIGMSVEQGVRHGKHSMELCKRFLSENNLDDIDYSEALAAIENHDNKEYRSTDIKYDFLSILSVADDLDAFGFAGIFRYAEIYLTRGIEKRDIGIKIKENATIRFVNFENKFGFSPDLIQKQKRQFNILNGFYDNYNLMASEYKFTAKDPHGYCGVIEIFAAMIGEKLQLRDIIEKNRYRSDDKIISWFFDGLAKEVL